MSTKAHRDLVDKLVRFQKCYASAVLEIGIVCNIYRTDPWEELVRVADRQEAAQALTDAGYEYVDAELNPGWHPAWILRRREFRDMRDTLTGYERDLVRLDAAVDKDRKYLLAIARSHLRRAAAQINTVQEAM